MEEPKETHVDEIVDDTVADTVDTTEEVSVKSDQEDTHDNGAGDGREPQIASEPETTFEERTGAGTPPWQKPDGSQDTGN